MRHKHVFITFALLSLAACAPIPPGEEYQWAGPWDDLNADRQRIGLDQAAIDRDQAQLAQDQAAKNEAAVQRDQAQLKQDEQRLKEDRRYYADDRNNRFGGSVKRRM